MIDHVGSVIGRVIAFYSTEISRASAMGGLG